MLYWQRLSHIPPPQPWYFPLEKRWGLQCHSCYTLNHDILLTPNTQVNYVSFSDRFQVHIWLVRYIYNKIVNTQATLITSIFLIPGATTFNIFSQYFSSVYNIFVGSITYLWKSVTSYQVVALKTGGYNSTLYQEYCQNIYTCCTPNQMGFYWKNSVAAIFVMVLFCQQYYWDLPRWKWKIFTPKQMKVMIKINKNVIRWVWTP